MLVRKGDKLASIYCYGPFAFKFIFMNIIESLPTHVEVKLGFLGFSFDSNLFSYKPFKNSEANLFVLFIKVFIAVFVLKISRLKIFPI